MTSPTPQHARGNPVARGWRAFRGWRRTRPFWGGLFTILAGLEIFATTQGSLGGLSFQMGPTGFLSWLIPTILVACGALMWATPAQRMFYAIVAAVTAVFSLIGVNLGGFFVGLLLGMVGSALGFAWTPVQPPEPVQSDGEPEAAPESGSETTVDSLLNGPEAPPQRDHWQESDVDATGEIPTQRPPGPGRSQLYAITIVLLSLAVTGAVVLRGGTPAHAAPCKPEPTPTAPTPTPSTTPTPAPESGADESGSGNIITDIIDGIGDLIGIGGGKQEQAPAAAATPTPTPSGTQAPGEPAEPTPTCPPDTAPGGAQPGGEDDEEQPVVTRVVDPPSDIEAINRIPSILTGSKLTNYNLEYHGVTDLPLRGGGTMKVLWFNMTKAVTDDFELKPTVPGNRRMSIKADPLTVEGNVRFFTPRFTGKLLGLDQVYTPTSPPPLIPGVPVPVLPITFTDVEIQLAYVDCGKLTANDLVNTP